MGPLLLAGIPVSDLAAAIDWYGRLFGDDKPFIPNDIEAVWDLAEGRSVYVVLDVHPVTSETCESGVRRVVFRGADRNEFGFGTLPGAFPDGDDDTSERSIDASAEIVER